MSIQARREWVVAQASRYQQSNKHDKHKILEEFIATTGYHPKYAIQPANGGGFDRNYLNFGYSQCPLLAGSGHSSNQIFSEGAKLILDYGRLFLGFTKDSIGVDLNI